MAAGAKVALVTGAGTGVGKAVALAPPREGYSVVLAGRRQDKPEETATEGKATNGKTHVVTADVSDPDSVKALFAETKATFGRLDVLFNNAGIGAPAVPMEELPLETWRMVTGQGVMQPDGRMMIEARMEADAVGRGVVYMASLPLDTNVLFLTVMANEMPFVGRG